MSEKTKVIFNRGSSPYTYLDPKTKKAAVLAPGAVVELPVEDANKLLVFSKDIKDTSLQKSTVVDESADKLKAALERITDLEMQLKQALAAIAESTKSKKGEK